MKSSCFIKEMFAPLVLVLLATRGTIFYLKASEPEDLQTKQTTAIALIIDKKPDFAMAENFNRIIDQGCITLVSSPIMHHPNTEIGKLHDTNKWRVFCDREKYFVLCVPKDNKQSLSEMGFNESAWSEAIATADLDIMLLSPDTQEKGIDEQWVNNFEHLWRKQDPAKYFYIIGHGLTNIAIAGIPMQYYPQVINILNRVNTRFAWINSCYLGGENLLTMQKALIGSLQTPYIIPQFIVIVESLGEQTTIASPSLNVKKMFDTVVAFFMQPNPPVYLGSPTHLKKQLGILPTKKITFSTIIKSYFSDVEAGEYYIENLPSVYIPGAGFFRAVELEHELIITALALKRYRLQEKLPTLMVRRKRIMQKQDAAYLQQAQKIWQQLQRFKHSTKPLTNSEKVLVAKLQQAYNAISRLLIAETKQAFLQMKQQSISTKQQFAIAVDDTIKAILIYPNDLHDATFNILGNEMPPCTSKIAGPAQHIIGTIESKTANLMAIFNGFLNEAFFREFPYAALRCWFIKEIRCTDDGKSKLSPETPLKLAGIAIFHDIYDNKSDIHFPIAIILCSLNGEYFFAVEPLPLSDQKIDWQRINLMQYTAFLAYLENKTKATNNSLFIATGGIENEDSQKETFNHFIESLGISSSTLQDAMQIPVQPLIDEQILAMQELLLSLSLAAEIQQDISLRNYQSIPYLEKQFKEKIDTLLTRTNTSEVAHIIQRLFKANNTKSALLASAMMFKNNHSDEMESIAQKLLTTPPDCDPFEIKNFFKFYLDSGNTSKAIKILEDFVSSLDTAKAPKHETITDVLPTVLPLFLGAVGYGQLKSIITKTIAAGLPLEKLLKEAIIYQDLDTVAQEITKDITQNNRQQRQQLEDIIKKAQQKREKIINEEVAKIDPATAMSNLSDPAGNYFATKAARIAIKEWMQKGDFNDVIEVLEGLIPTDSSQPQNKAQIENENIILDLLLANSVATAQLQENIIKTIKQQTAKPSPLGIQLAVELVKKTKNYEIIRPIINILCTKDDVYWLTALAAELVQQKMYAMALKIAEEIEKSPLELTSYAQLIYNYLPAKYQKKIATEPAAPTTIPVAQQPTPAVIPVQQPALTTAPIKEKPTPIVVSAEEEKWAALLKRDLSEAYDYLAQQLPATADSIMSAEKQKQLENMIKKIITTQNTEFLRSYTSNLMQSSSPEEQQHGIIICIELAKQGGFNAIEDVVVDCALMPAGGPALIMLAQQLAKRGSNDMVQKIKETCYGVNNKSLAEQIGTLLQPITQ